MSLLDSLRHRLGVFVRRGRFARELDEEIEFHLSLEEMHRGHAAHGEHAPGDARDAARRSLGNLTILKEEKREMAGLGFLDVAQQDVRFALRTFRRAPGFTAIAILTLAIGIGANTAIFSAVNAMLLRPLPFPEPDRLMKVGLTAPPRGSSPARVDLIWSYPKFTAFRDAQRLFVDLALYTDNQSTIAGDGEPERLWGEVAGARYLTTLGVRPSLGRNFLAEEDQHPGGPRVAMLADELWKRRYNADPAVLGRTLVIDRQPHTIVGILPPGFRGLSGRAEWWTPLMAVPADELNQAWMHSYTLIARLRPGVSIEQAQRIVPQLGVRVDRAYPHPEVRDEHWGAMARPLDATRVDPMVRRSLLVLLGAVAMVLLIACANVANLFLVRAAGRRREIAVRLAVGAGRRRLVRQLLTESILLSLLGGVASIVVAWWGVKLLAALDPGRALRIRELSGIGAVNFGLIHLDVTALVFAGALSVGTGLIFGLVPALQATRPSLTDALKDGSASGRPAGIRGLSSRNVLAVTEIALALVLLAGSGVMLRSLRNLIDVNPGFDASHLLTARYNAPAGTGRDSLPQFYDQLIERMSAIPGVTGVGMSDCPPLNGGCNGTVIWFRDKPPVAEGTEPDVGVHWVTPEWPAVMRMPLKRGRMFTHADGLRSPKVVLVNETAARTFWPDQDPIGRPMSVGQGGFSKDTAYVIGVIGDTRYGTLDSLPKPDAYLSYYQSPRGRTVLFLRTAGDPTAIATAARRALRELAPSSPVYDVMTMEARVASATAFARFSAVLLALFGGVALALATMGTYGVISFGVAQRTREIGIRVALGASRSSVLRLIVQQGLRLALIGGVIGLMGALAGTRVLPSLLFGVAPSDPVTFGAIVILLVVAVCVASWIPARRAANVQPVEALRFD
ncbi:MAG: ADOP family duplicated permease [Gemmatimonadaceae bacterium]